MKVRKSLPLFFIIICYLVLNLVYSTTGNAGGRDLALLLIIGSLLIVDIRSDELKLLVLSVGLGFFFLIKLAIYNEFYSTGFLPIAIVACGIILRRVYKYYASYLYKINSLIIIVTVFWVLYKFYVGGVSISQLQLVYYSINTITTIVLVFFTLSYLGYYYEKYVLRKESKGFLLHIAALFTIIISLHLGRTGIISAVFIILLYMWELLNRFPKLKIPVYLFISYLAFYVVRFISNTNSIAQTTKQEDTYLSSVSRIQSEGLESQRWDIWETVLNQIGPIKTYFGLDKNLSVSLTGFGWHNGYLEAYSLYGILGLSLILIILYILLKKCLKFDIRITILCFALLVRAFFDTHLINPYVGPTLILIWFLVKKRKYERVFVNLHSGQKISA